MFLFAVAIMYIMRTNLSFAVTGQRGMVKELGWSGKQEGLALSSFFWGYIVSQVAGGKLAMKFGGKPVMLFSMLLCSLLSGR